VKPSELYEQLLESPSHPIRFRDFEQLLRAFGFALKRVRGSHKSYRHPAAAEVLTVQPHGKDAEPYQVRKFLAIVREHKLTADD
jgi:predicted RNA binding protein YcfA (HicA-like mRNA interferase family)